MAKRRSETELTRDIYNASVERDSDRSRPVNGSFERADSSTLQSRRMVRRDVGESSPAPPSSSNPFANVRLSNAPQSTSPGTFSFGGAAAAKSAPNSNAYTRELAKLHEEHRARIREHTSRNNGNYSGSMTDMILKFLNQVDRLADENEPLPEARPDTSIPSTMEAPPLVPAVPLPETSITATASLATIPETLPEDAEDLPKEESTPVARVVDPDWQDVAEYPKVRIYLDVVGKGFQAKCAGVLRVQQHTSLPEARIIVRDELGLKVKFGVRIHKGYTFALVEPTATAPGKKQLGSVHFFGSVEGKMEKIAIKTAYPQAKELHQKLQELAK